MTKEVSQPLVSGLAEEVKLNIDDISVTADVFQPLVSGLAEVAFKNIYDMLVTEEVSQPLVTGLAEEPENICDMLSVVIWN